MAHTDLPFVRFAKKILYVNRGPTIVAAYDARLFMPLSDGGSITIEETKYPLRRFDLFYIPPGVPYRIESGDFISLISINFDHTRFYEEQKKHRRPVSVELFDKSRLINDAPEAFSRPIVLKRMELLHQKVLETVKETSLPDGQGERMASLLLAECLVHILRAHEHPVSEKEEALTETALAFLEEHATERDCEEKLCALLSYHPYYINRILKKHTGETVHSYVLRMRMNMAAALLRAGAYKNEEIAAMVGLPNPAHFAKTFRRYMGVTPSAYRKAPPAL